MKESKRAAADLMYDMPSSSAVNAMSGTPFGEYGCRARAGCALRYLRMLRFAPPPRAVLACVPL